MARLIEAFEVRVQRQLKSKRLFPWHIWCAVMDVGTPRQCADLNGRTWSVDDPELMRAAREHFAQGLRGCRCTGMAVRTKTEEGACEGQ